MARPDVIVNNHGTIVVLTPTSPAGQEWIDDNISPDATMWGSGIVVEPRYVGDIIDGMESDGLTIA